MKRANIVCCALSCRRNSEERMTKQVIFDNEFATLWYYPEAGIVHHQIKKFLTAPPLKAMLSKGTEVLKAKHATKWLSDDRNNGALPPEIIPWIKNEWEPQTVHAGWKFWAQVLPVSVIAQMNAKRFQESAGQAGVVKKQFADPVEALRWLESQK